MLPYAILAIEDDSDWEFMSRLYLNYQRLMYSEVRKITRDEWIVDDIVHDTVVKLIDKITLLKTLQQRQLINYIISASKNTAFNYLKKKTREDALGFDDLPPNLENGNTFVRDVEYDVILRDDLERLFVIWKLLDSRSQYLLEGRYILGKTTVEMAEDLGIKPGSVRMALTRARHTAYQFIMNEKSSGST